MRSNILSKYEWRSAAPTAGEIAGVLSFTTAIILSATATLYGEPLTYAQATSPTLGNSLWTVSAGLAATFVVIATVFAMMVALGIISAVGTPRLYGRTEYTIIGSGGVLGAVSTMTISVAAQVTNSDVR